MFFFCRKTLQNPSEPFNQDGDNEEVIMKDFKELAFTPFGPSILDTGPADLVLLDFAPGGPRPFVMNILY